VPPAAQDCLVSEDTEHPCCRQVAVLQQPYHNRTCPQWAHRLMMRTHQPFRGVNTTKTCHIGSWLLRLMALGLQWLTTGACVWPAGAFLAPAHLHMALEHVKHVTVLFANFHAGQSALKARLQAAARTAQATDHLVSCHAAPLNPPASTLAPAALSRTACALWRPAQTADGWSVAAMTK
jgi:hypothetical protein